MTQRLGANEFSHNDLPDWRWLIAGLQAAFHCGSYLAAGAFAARITEAADRLGHYPQIDVRAPDLVQVTTTSADAHGVTQPDVELASVVSDLAAAAGHRPAPQALARLEIAIDSADIAAIRPFWRAVLGYADQPQRDGAVDVVHPSGLGPAIWFQQSEPRAGRNRIHMDVYVPVELAQQRVADTVAAGGTLVTDRFAPSWWVLADADGNEACVCTWNDPPDGS
ncbi:VOC family protein [Nakamurella aerolata]|uniref:Putative pterin-4-alpha-carbinolamine dehydratase n=1 Tax=Nakamurella aerolata TaxID=1656892 RepID=A0A849A991_9ACTN|nr:VOC family protein [Nakamurella aerolata]NNG35658.1 pterin-4-alpha-carbinolamine dehydratase [Nakamurella aerolata]